ncbi:peptide ABC transporter ATP-binding protein [Fictibacillus arsenicus]|uniref:Peptide ABC transporter ATP-binding protein n=2 Tax=Fictibacillus arsenicus TaxID=255247 RepID=A0A1B1Z273_9BACL|nr:peptide ABC transporter ATP-binding protein [Fictibacillus arsenicus]
MTNMLEINSLTKTYGGNVILNGISLTMNQGESLGIIGESGSGKSTLSRVITGLDNIDEGEVVFQGISLDPKKGKSLKKLRRHVQIVFQDPSSSLNPKLPVWKSAIEPLENYTDAMPAYLQHVKHNKKSMAEVLFNKVGLSKDLLERYPHQLSGGQKQRVAIARGISLQPDLLICDEPTSSLDVSIQAQILNLLKELKRDLNMSYLFISHDLAAVQFMCDKIAVLKDGTILDMFRTEEIFSETRHEYTKKLVSIALQNAL